MKKSEKRFRVQVFMGGAWQYTWWDKISQNARGANG